MLPCHSQYDLVWRILVVWESGMFLIGGLRVSLSVLLLVSLAVWSPSRGVHAEGTAAVVAGGVVAEGNEKDIGTIETLPSRGDITVVFRWKNKTDRILRVQEARGGCPVLTTVSHSKSSVEAGETIDFVVRSRPGQRYGELRFWATVSFQDDGVPQEVFSIRCFRPQPPTVLPGTVDFGAITNAGAARPFALTATLPPNSTGMKLLGDIRSSHPEVSSTLVDVRSVPQRESGETVSVRRVFRFDAQVTGGRPSGALKGRFFVPVLYEDREIELEVPFRGQFAHQLTLQPSRMVVFAAPEEKKREITATLSQRGSGRLVRDVTASCSHPDVSARFAPSAGKGHGGTRTLGRLAVSVRLDDGVSFETEVLMDARSGDQAMQICVPLKVQVVESSQAD